MDITRRNMYALTGVLGAAALVGAGASPAKAQAAEGESTMQRIQRTKKLRFAVVANQEPYFRKDLTTGEWRGFCVEMAKDIAQNLDVEVEMLESTWGNSVLDLQSNKIDMAFGLNPTPKRALMIDFPAPLFYNKPSFVGKKGFRADTWNELNKPEVKIAFDLGTSRETIVRRFAPNATHVAYKTSSECVMSVASGRSDCFACSVFLGLAARKANPSMGDFFIPQPAMETVTTAAIQYDSDGRFRQFLNAWTDFNRGNGQIREWIINALAEMDIQEADLPEGLNF